MRRKRTTLFSKEQQRQKHLLPRVEKIQVTIVVAIGTNPTFKVKLTPHEYVSTIPHIHFMGRTKSQQYQKAPTNKSTLQCRGEAFTSEKNPVFSPYVDLQMSLINVDNHGVVSPAL